jgi:hypothetical protein
MAYIHSLKGIQTHHVGVPEIEDNAYLITSVLLTNIITITKSRKMDKKVM